MSGTRREVIIGVRWRAVSTPTSAQVAEFLTTACRDPRGPFPNGS
jgi:hypothetical protein